MQPVRPVPEMDEEAHAFSAIKAIGVNSLQVQAHEREAGHRDHRAEDVHRQREHAPRQGRRLRPVPGKLPDSCEWSLHLTLDLASFRGKNRAASMNELLYKLGIE